MSCPLIFLIIYILQISKCAAVAASGGVDGDSRAIYHGTAATLGQFPYVVYTINRATGISGGWQCTGSILTEYWVVTGVHCYERYPSNITLSDIVTTIIAGVVDRRLKPGQSRKSDHVILRKYDRISPSARWQPYENDIALLKVSEKFDFNSAVGAITVAKSPLLVGKKIKCIVVGFGHTHVVEEQTNRLYYTNGSLDGDPSSCKKKKGENICLAYILLQTSKDNLCFDPDNYLSVPCYGDSGGPLVCDGLIAGTAIALINVHTCKSECAVKDTIYFYTYLGYHESWLRKHIPELPPFKEARNEEQARSPSRRAETESRGGDRWPHVVYTWLVPLATCCILLQHSSTFLE